MKGNIFTFILEPRDTHGQEYKVIPSDQFK